MTLTRLTKTVSLRPSIICVTMIGLSVKSARPRGIFWMTAIHKVGAEPELYTVELNSTANDVNEQVIKGNIAIIKHTDNGETQIETPEEGAVFEVF